MANPVTGNPSTPNQRVGAIINVADSTALAALDPSGLTVGTTVYTVDTDAYWDLKVSSAALSSTVVAVNGITGLRWLARSADSGFVTYAALADTSVTSGATLIGVNANGGMFSEPNLQLVLQTDVVLKVPLAATDGSGGAQLVGVNTGGKYTSTNVESALDTEVQTIKNPSQFTLTSGNLLSATLADAATNAASTIRRMSHTSSGTAAAGFGNKEIQTIPSSTGVARDATVMTHAWTTATNAAEDAQLKISALRAGSSVDLARFNGSSASGNAPLEILSHSVDDVAIAFTESHDQQIQKYNGGDLAFRARAGGSVYMASVNYAGMGVMPEANSLVDTFVGRNVGIGDAATNGLFWIPTLETAAWKPAALTPAGFLAHHAGLAFNVVDGKLYISGNGHLWSLTATVVI